MKEEEVKTHQIEAENKRLKEQQQLDESRLKQNTLTSISPNTSNDKSSTTNGSNSSLAKVKSLIGENVQMMSERGEKLRNMNEQSEKLNNAAMDFAKMAEQLRKQQEARAKLKWWEF